uniref:Uncharacterized protein n=1 Tax=Anguilla anguilla TaxID=7936 RepID=A0A0E9XG43_ANGAN
MMTMVMIVLKEVFQYRERSPVKYKPIGNGQRGWFCSHSHTSGTEWSIADLRRPLDILFTMCS